MTTTTHASLATERPLRPDAIVITGTALNTPLGDTVDGVLDALLAGRSGITPWRAFPTPPLGARVGGDLSAYDAACRLRALREVLPAEPFRRLDRMFRRLPWSARLTLLVAADAALAARYWSPEPVAEEVAVLAAGHNLSPRYAQANWEKYQREPDYIDPLLAVHMLDSNHPACVSELLGSRGPIGTVGAACASGNVGLRAAADELRDGAGMVVLVAPLYEYGPQTLQALGFMRATTEAAEPAGASRPFALGRDGFVPAHGAAALVLETAAHAAARGVPALAEVLSVEASSDACHRPPRPSPPDQAALIRTALDRAGVLADLVSAHAASTVVGDLAEAKALRLALGPASETTAINAPKSMLGHTGWSCALVQLVLGVAQLRRGEVHGTANLETPDPEMGLFFPGSGSRPLSTLLVNAFGFGGLNAVAVVRRCE